MTTATATGDLVWARLPRRGLVLEYVTLSWDVAGIFRLAAGSGPARKNYIKEKRPHRVNSL